MKKIITLLFLGMFLISNVSNTALAAKKPTGGLTDEQITSMNSCVDKLTQKMYSHSYFSPADISNLTGTKIKLDDAMLMSPDPKYSVLYYKIGRIYQKRGNKDDAIECYQVIIENFADTAIAPKAGAALKVMGVTVSLPEKGGSDEEE